MNVPDGIVEQKGSVRYLDPENHIGFDIFCEDVEEPAKVEEDQRRDDMGQ